MAIDYAALLGATAGIQVAKARWDWSTDPSSVGVHALAGDLIPNDVIIIGAMLVTKDALLQAGFPTNIIGCVEQDPLITFAADTPNYFAWVSQGNLMSSIAARALTFEIVTAEITQGSFGVWVFYLPT